MSIFWRPTYLNSSQGSTCRITPSGQHQYTSTTVYYNTTSYGRRERVRPTESDPELLQTVVTRAATPSAAYPPCIVWTEARLLTLGGRHQNLAPLGSKRITPRLSTRVPLNCYNPFLDPAQPEPTRGLLLASYGGHRILQDLQRSTDCRQPRGRC